MKYIKKIINNPINIIITGIAILRGSYYILRYKSNSRIKIKFPLIAYASVSICGPGYVYIGRGCSVYKNVFVGLRIISLNPNAQIFIGENCSLGGLTIRCREKVKIGDRVMTAVCLIQDTFCISNVRLDKYNDLLLKPIPIELGNNVWIGGHSCILGGSRIGNDCVVALNSVSYNRNQNEYSFASGNPIKRDLPIDAILKFKG